MESHCQGRSEKALTGAGRVFGNEYAKKPPEHSLAAFLWATGIVHRFAIGIGYWIYSGNVSVFRFPVPLWPFCPFTVSYGGWVAEMVPAGFGGMFSGTVFPVRFAS